MERIEINTANKYDIFLLNDELNQFENLIKEVYDGKKIYVITDTNVKKYHLDKLVASLPSFDVKTVVVNAGEESKSLDTYKEVVEQLLKLNITRQELLIAFGGGVIGDLTGFVSATLYRGIPFIQIPTTLLSMVDSSIGGKTGIDFNNYKNILGAFNQPKRVLIDISYLKTLDLDILKSGYGEMIKHALIKSEALLEKLENLDDVRKITLDIIKDNILIKKEFVEKDEFDNNLRMQLNFGHTFGHLIELEHEMLHGDAVLSGILCAFDLGEKFRFKAPEIKERVLKLYQKLQLNYIEVNYLELLPQVFNDKKNIRGKVNFIFLSKVGFAIIVPLTEIQLCAL